MNGRQLFAWLASGILFGAGLAISGMISPLKVLGFLDFAGDWDPTLLLVMVGAVVTYAVGHRLILRRSRPLLADKFHMPTRRDLDASLIAGSALFGAGWGLAGYCPGPAIAALSVSLAEPALFCVAMLTGMLLRAATVRRPVT